MSSVTTNGCPLVLAEVEDAHDVRVRAEASHRLGLTGDPLPADVVEPVGLDQRERHLAIQELVVGQEHALLAALAEELLDLVTPTCERRRLRSSGHGDRRVKPRPGWARPLYARRRADGPFRRLEIARGVDVAGVELQRLTGAGAHGVPVGRVCGRVGVVEETIDASLDSLTGHEGGVSHESGHRDSRSTVRRHS